jgi:predicted DNA-binding transcriptional regulator AlpA
MAESSTDQVSFGWTEPAGSSAGPMAHGPGDQHGRGVPSPPLPPDNELWDVRAAARFLKRSVSWVYHKAEDGTLPVRRLGGWGIRFIPGELRAWVESDGVRRTGR